MQLGTQLISQVWPQLKAQVPAQVLPCVASLPRTNK